ncbi:hypothetical protein JCM19298_975 [Nonlabens ulvanivorans]|nr:gliding motility protein GldM [Nonlabens ulvanivorans]GAK93638.1 hypothetical protein JCM19298_975 [Nonlabens ulvanivorans]
MAGGKQSPPRQKMINLMYLVFIAMLALNMSKEVLNAFGLLNVSIEESNLTAAANNASTLDGLAQLASDQPEKYDKLKDQGDQVDKISDEYFNYIQSLKDELEGTVEDPTDYQVMDKGDYLDTKFLESGVITEEGQRFLDEMNNYRKDMIAIVGEESELAGQLKTKFTPSEEENRDGVMVPYLEYNYQGFPLIASVAKLTLLQSEIKSIESKILGTLLSGSLKSEVSMTNYTTLMETPKSAYYNGEMFDGQIVLGRKDATLKPKTVALKLDGRALSASQYSVEDGRVVLKVGAGSPGEHKITGELIYEQDGEPLPVLVEQTFSTIPKPNSATISADKMNVVYRGVDNPMTITFAGVSSNNVNASASGLTRSGSGYVMKPSSGKEVKINVTGKLSTGETVSDSKTFRIKDLPRPIGTISREYIDVKKNRSNLAVSTVGATFGDDFDFELTPRVTEFLFKVPGAPSVKVSGTKLNSAAQGNLRKARKGDIVQFAGIKATVPGVKLKTVTPVAVELLD